MLFDVCFCLQEVLQSQQSGGQWPRVQCCVVPALPKSCLVEWQLCAWAGLTCDTEGSFSISSGQEDGELEILEMPRRIMTSNNWTIETECLFCKKESRLFTCHIQVDLVSPEIEMSKEEQERCVKDMVEQYFFAYNYRISHIDGEMAGNLSVPLVKLLFAANLFDYDLLHKLVMSCLSDSCSSKHPVISLVPVACLETSSHILAWCQV